MHPREASRGAGPPGNAPPAARAWRGRRGSPGCAAARRALLPWALRGACWAAAAQHGEFLVVARQVCSCCAALLCACCSAEAARRGAEGVVGTVSRPLAAWRWRGERRCHARDETLSAAEFGQSLQRSRGRRQCDAQHSIFECIVQQRVFGITPCTLLAQGISPTEGRAAPPGEVPSACGGLSPRPRRSNRSPPSATSRARAALAAQWSRFNSAAAAMWAAEPPSSPASSLEGRGVSG